GNLATANGAAMRNVCCGPSTSRRPDSFSGEPIVNAPAGTTTMAGREKLSDCNRPAFHPSGTPNISRSSTTQAKKLLKLAARKAGEFRLGRVERRVAEAPALILLIGLEIALEPFHMAVAFEGEDMGREPVQEEAIVADDHGAAWEILKRRLE